EENFLRVSDNLVTLQGHMSKIRSRINESNAFTDRSKVKVDPFFRESIPGFDPWESRLAHFVQLNYPYYSLDEKREMGPGWDRMKWAMVRVGDYYHMRTDPGFSRAEADEVREFGKYMDNYFFRMNHISSPDGTYPFAEGAGSFLHSHRGIRDNVKEEYTKAGGLERQILSGKVIEHIVMGTVPAEFITDTTTRWDPWKNELYRMEEGSPEPIPFTPEGEIRYAGLRSAFLNRTSEDVLYEPNSTVITRTFENNNLKPDEVEKLIRDFLSDPVFAEVGKLIENRLGRTLQPFDLWYSGFQEQSLYGAEMLDSITKARYPDPMALQNDLGDILVRMGFEKGEAEYIGNHISVRPVGSGGYSNQPPLRNDTALLTTMFGTDGLDYKSYRVAMHELGHNVCGIYSTRNIDNFVLAGVPTGGITEGYAELLAYKNIQGLGLKASTPEEQKHNLALAAFWYLAEMGGQALTEIEVWKWMYANPGFSAGELSDAVNSITTGIWNQYYSEIFGGLSDQHILAIYNHFITGSHYLYNYYMANVIVLQLSDAFEGDNLAANLENACLEGETLPELWMVRATGEDISLNAVITGSQDAVRYYKQK
ncbi:MAG: hypothetical protein LC649_07275, partial [Bacteroidales bacterium]|nr:hypothetical protein [Bacteroidales bacterium]